MWNVLKEEILNCVKKYVLKVDEFQKWKRQTCLDNWIKVQDLKLKKAQTMVTIYAIKKLEGI